MTDIKRHSGRLIKTSHVYPPIPVRAFDWCAWFDDTGEEGLTGNGTTEQEAIADLIERLEDQ